MSNSHHINLKQVIINLIKDDLTNFKLVNGLSEIGLDATSFHLQLNDAIFLLMGFNKREDTDGLRDWYFREAEKVYSIDVLDRNTDELEKLVLNIFAGLEEIRRSLNN